MTTGAGALAGRRRRRACVVTVLTITMLAACSGGSGGPPASVAISGQLRYERPVHNPGCLGLDFANVELRPIRAVTVRVFDASTNSVLASTVTDQNGRYSVSVASRTDVFLRARAELKRIGGPAWDVEVRDNTCDDTNPLRQCSVPLAQRPIYVLDSAAFNSGTAATTVNLRAATGWDSNIAGFTGTRSAAPFAVLDSIYEAMLAMSAVDAALDFPALIAFWSVNNTPAISNGFDVDSGELGTTFYQGGNLGSIFLVGADGIDIEEFDEHVITHEWGHYFEDRISRSDSIGGPHARDDNLDPRTAFGEGFATALSGIILDDPGYCDAMWFGATLSGFGFSIENSASVTPGWYDEFSVQQIMYDLWDSDIDGVDTDSIGFDPVYAVMNGSQAVTPAFTSIFTFMESLRAQNPAAVPFIDTLLAAQEIDAAGIDSWGSGETNNAGGAADVLPVYVEVLPNGASSTVCNHSRFDFVGAGGVREFGGNKLGMHRYLRMTLATNQRLSFSIVADAATLAALPPDDVNDPIDQADPDILIYRDGVLQNAFVNGDFEGTSGDANREIFIMAAVLAAGDYAMDFNDFRFADPNTAQDYPSRTCFDITITAVP